MSEGSPKLERLRRPWLPDDLELRVARCDQCRRRGRAAPMVAVVYVLDGVLRWVDRPKRRPGRLRGNSRSSHGTVKLLPVNLTLPRTPVSRRDRTLLLWCNGHRRELRVGIGRLEDVVAATDSQVVYI